MTLKFVIILQNLIKAYHRKSGKSKYDRKLTELDVETTWIRSRVNGVSVAFFLRQILTDHILSIASAITLDINTSRISSIDSATAGFIITNYKGTLKTYCYIIFFILKGHLCPPCPSQQRARGAAAPPAPPVLASLDVRQ